MCQVLNKTLTYFNKKRERYFYSRSPLLQETSNVLQNQSKYTKKTIENHNKRNII